MTPFETVELFESYGLTYIRCGLVGVAIILIIAILLLSKTRKYRLIAAIITLGLILSSIPIVYGLTLSVKAHHKLDSTIEKLQAESRDKLDSLLEDKYGVSLRTEAIQVKVEGKKINAYLKDGLVNGTSSDGKNIQLSFEVTGPGELIAYSSGIELPTLESEVK